ncbi:MAG: hypothetical protein ACRBB2_04175 [Nitrosopumilus sp.]
MFIKLGIIAGVIILTGMIFSTEINNMFPATSATVTNSLKEDVTSLSAKASNTVEQKIDNSIDTIVNKTSTTITNEVNKAGDKISTEFSEAKESSQHLIEEKLSNLDPIGFIQNVFSDWNLYN